MDILESRDPLGGVNPKTPRGFEIIRRMTGAIAEPLYGGAGECWAALAEDLLTACMAYVVMMYEHTKDLARPKPCSIKYLESRLFELNRSKSAGFTPADILAEMSRMSFGAAQLTSSERRLADFITHTANKFILMDENERRWVITTALTAFLYRPNLNYIYASGA